MWQLKPSAGDHPCDRFHGKSSGAAKPHFAIGNAPTALIELDTLIRDGKLHPALVIGVPVGFVNVVESKNLILRSGAYIVWPRAEKGQQRGGGYLQCTAVPDHTVTRWNNTLQKAANGCGWVYHWSCAAAAAKAAAWMLLTGRRKEKITLMTPKGLLLELCVREIRMQEGCVSCATERMAEMTRISPMGPLFCAGHPHRFRICIDGGRA